MTFTESQRRRLARHFENFAEQAPALYAQITRAVANSRETLDMYEDIDEDKHKPVLLLAAVHYMVLKGTAHRLGALYQNPDAPASLESVGDAFLDFCEKNERELLTIMATHRVQTNEVNRCVALLPALMAIARETKKPLALVELGASAGLNLLFDHYRYDYLGGPAVGPLGAIVRLSTKLVGAIPQIDPGLPMVETRIGIDLEPIDARDEDAATWLKACVWVGEVGREQRLDAALTAASKEWLEVKEGNAITELAGLVKQVSGAQTVVIFTSWMASWLSPEDRLALTERITEIGRRREIYWVSFEGEGVIPGLPEPSDVPGDASVLGLQRIGEQGTEARLLALVNHHGTWLDWRDPSTTWRNA